MTHVSEPWYIALKLRVYYFSVCQERPVVEVIQTEGPVIGILYWKWYHDRVTRKCRAINYGANEQVVGQNSFDSSEECENTCFPENGSAPPYSNWIYFQWMKLKCASNIQNVCGLLLTFVVFWIVWQLFSLPWS